MYFVIVVYYYSLVWNPDSRNRHFDFTSDVGYLITKLTVEGSSSRNSGAEGSNKVFSSVASNQQLSFL